MHIFIIPSWYPHRCHPLEGTFLLEQATAMGELRPAWNIGISRWGQGEGRVSFAHLRASPQCFAAAVTPPYAFEREVSGNTREFMTRALSWNEAILDGNRGALLEANRRNLRRAERRFGPANLLHAHVSYPGGWIAMHLAAERGIPYVVTEHMGPFPLAVYENTDGSLKPYIREPLERAQARIAVSPALADSIERFGIPRPKYVPNVVDERLYSIARPAPDAPFTFFTLGGMQPVKGFPDLLEAIALFLRRLDEPARARVAFRLGGYGPCLEAYQARCRELGLDRWVSWLGFLSREQARAEFHRCDAYVLASHHESFGIVLVEAMAAGKPVVATRCGGPEGIVTPASGRLVDVRNPAQLAEGMFDLFSRREAYIPEVIRDGYLRQFSRAAVVNRLEEIYAHVRRQAAPRP